jgi:hypothetical protein
MLIDYQTKVDALLRDQDARIESLDRNAAIADALREYSKRRPRLLVQDVSGDGTRLLPLPAAWVTDFSAIRTIEYPIGSLPPTLFPDHAFYQSPSTLKILTPSAVAPAASARVTFTVRHQVDGGTDTIPVDDLEAVCNYAAAVLFEQLAAIYAGSGDATIAADTVDHRSKASEFRQQAATCRRRFYEQLGVDPKKNNAAGAVVNLDLQDSLGQDRLTHSNRYR